MIDRTSNIYSDWGFTALWLNAVYSRQTHNIVTGETEVFLSVQIRLFPVCVAGLSLFKVSFIGAYFTRYKLYTVSVHAWD